MSRRVQISVYPDQGMSRMTDYDDEKILVEIYDPDIEDQEMTLVEFAEKLGYVLVEEYEYERQQ